MVVCPRLTRPQTVRSPTTARGQGFDFRVMDDATPLTDPLTRAAPLFVSVATRR